MCNYWHYILTENIKYWNIINNVEFVNFMFIFTTPSIPPQTSHMEPTLYSPFVLHSAVTCGFVISVNTILLKLWRTLETKKVKSILSPSHLKLHQYILIHVDSYPWTLFLSLQMTDSLFWQLTFDLIWKNKQTRYIM